jgi:hypothetical protein
MVDAYHRTVTDTIVDVPDRTPEQGARASTAHHRRTDDPHRTGSWQNFVGGALRPGKDFYRTCC